MKDWAFVVKNLKAFYTKIAIIALDCREFLIVYKLYYNFFLSLIF